jgi:hypothetical protein
VAVGLLPAALDQTIVGTALPTIAGRPGGATPTRVLLTEDVAKI